MKHATVAIIILTYNQRERTLRCLESCRKLSGIDYKILLWDNGSSDETINLIHSKYPELLILRSEKNIGVATGRNASAKKAIEYSPDYLLFLDNDTTVQSDFLLNLTKALCDSEFTIAAPKIKFLENPEYLYGAGGLNVVFRKGKTQHLGYNEIDRGQYDKNNSAIPSGGCLLVKTEVFFSLNGFDEIFSPYGPEDIDFVLRARAKGFNTVYVPDSVIFHESRPGKTAQKNMRYSLRRIYHWIIILRRHARFSDLVIFLLFYVPFLSLKQIFSKFREN